MDIWRLLGAALRRWYILLPIALLSGLLAVNASERVAPEYSASASALLVRTGQATMHNPFADLNTAATSMSIVLQSGEGVQRIREAGGEAGVQVSAVTRMPILNFQSRAPSAEAAVGSVTAALNFAVTELEARQTSSGVPAEEQVRFQVLAPPSPTAVSTSAKQQRMVLILGIGLVVAFLAAVFIDDLILLWRRRRTRRGEGRAARQPRRSLRRPRAGRSATEDGPGDGPPDEAPRAEKSPVTAAVTDQDPSQDAVGGDQEPGGVTLLPAGTRGRGRR